MSRNLIFKLVSVFLGLLVSLVLLEAGVRLLGLSSGLKFIPDPYVGWVHRASHTYTSRMEGRTIEIKINSRGLRDHEYAYEKPENTFRILVLGDSFTEAFQVHMDDSFPKLIENRLNNESAGEVQVINAGASGYGTDNELLFYRHEGLKYEPDIVLLALYIGNDIRNNWYKLENQDAGGTQKPYFVPEGDGLAIREFPFFRQESLFSRVKMFLNIHVRLYSFLRETKNNLRHRDSLEKAGMPIDFNLFKESYSSEWDNAWKVTKALLLKLNTEVKQKNARLYVVLIPSQMQVHKNIWEEQKIQFEKMQNTVWDMDKPNRILDDFLARNDIAYIDLLPDYRKFSARIGKELYLRSDGHWNEAGHKLAADLIVKDLARSSVIPRTASEN